MQSEELRLQREEIKANREELKRTASAQEEQGKHLSRQAENLKQSAKLSALNTLVNHYNEKAKMERELKKFIVNNKCDEYLKKAESYASHIEDILNQKNDKN